MPVVLPSRTGAGAGARTSRQSVTQSMLASRSVHLLHLPKTSRASGAHEGRDQWRGAGRGGSSAATRVRARAGRARAQPEERGRGHPPRRAGGVHRRVGIGEVVARLRHPLRRGAAALPGVGVAVRAAPLPPARRPRGRFHRRAATRGGAPAAARLAHHALVGGERHHAVEPAAHAVLARRRRSPRPAAAPCGGVLHHTSQDACPRCGCYWSVSHLTVSSRVA
jgi:hypothetical protein